MKLVYCFVYLLHLVAFGNCFHECYRCDVIPGSTSTCGNCTCQDCMVGKTKELYVDCSFNHLTHLPALPVHNTSIYNLAANLIQKLGNDSFRNTPSIRILCLGKNELIHRGIGETAFRGLRDLQSLSFQENIKLMQLKKSWFNDLVSLQNLTVAYCSISVIEKNAFQNCEKLELINLSNNWIKTVHDDIFRNLKSLKQLYLSSNKILKVMDFAFEGSDKLQLLILHNNQLNTITKSFGLLNMTGLREINLAFNPFHCDCELVWFRQWLNSTNVTLQNWSETKCTDPTLYPLIDFDVDDLNCEPLWLIVYIVIPVCSVCVILIIVITILYYYRRKLRYWNQRRINRKQYRKICEEGPAVIDGDNIRHDAFVSYHNSDQRWILSVLQPTLEQQPYNLKLCLDYRDFIAGEKILDNIENAVKHSRKVLIVVSNSFADGEWSYFELERARMRMFDNREDILVVVLLEKLAVKNTPVLLQQILNKNTYIRWSANPDGQRVFWLKLIAALQAPNIRRNDEFAGTF